MYQGKLYKRAELNVAKWDAFIEAHSNNVVYFFSWYLDAICNDWNAIVIEKADEWIGVMPMHFKRKYFIDYSLQPFFCKYLGVLIKRDIKENAQQKKVMYAIIDTIPSGVKYFNYYFHPSFDYFVPFRWRGYNVSPHYTYKLDISTAPDFSFSTSIYNHIRKSIKNNIRCTVADSTELLLKIAIERGLLKTDMQNAFLRLWAKPEIRNQGIILIASDNSGDTHAAAAFVMCGQHVYMIISVVNSELKTMGGNALLINEAFTIFQKKGAKWFHFEGSMLENVEAYINGFKAERELYFNISKASLPLLNQLVLPMYRKLKSAL